MTSRFQRLLRVVVLFAGIFLCLNTSRGQTWTQIGSFYGKSLTCAFFWDTAHGVVGGDHVIYKYNSGTWTQGHYPEAFTGNSKTMNTLPIGAIRELRPGILYAVGGATQVWVSSDSGSNWALSGIPNNGGDVYIAKDGTIHCTPAGTFARLDSNISILTGDDFGRNIYSTDGGETWLTSGTTYTFGFGAYADTCRKEFFQATEEGKLYTSLDSGRVWSQVPGIIRGADLMEGIDEILFRPDSAVLCSIDGGYSWKSRGGPDNLPLAVDDTRPIFAFRQNGIDLITIDTENQVWLCRGADANLAPASPLGMTYDTIIGCAAARIPIRIMPWEPGRSFTFHIHITTDTGSSSSDVDTIITCPPGDTITYWFNLPAANSGNTQNDAQWIISTTGGDGCLTFSWDRPFRVQRIPSPPEIRAPQSLAVKQCSDVSYPIFIHTSPCESIRIDSIDYGNAKILVTWNIAFPDTILAGTNDTVLGIITPTVPGSQTVYLYCNIFRMGQEEAMDTTLIVSIVAAAAPERELVSAPTNLTVSNCMSDALPIYFHALACDSIEFTSCTLTLDTGLAFSKSITLPILTAPNATDTLLLTFPPQNLSGVYIVTADIRGKYVGSNAAFDTTIQIRVTFTNAGNALVSDVNDVLFDSVSLCSEADTTLTFTNLGCDTLTVTSDATTWYAGWSADDPAFPLTLPPGSTFAVRIHFSPIGLAFSAQTIDYKFEYEGGKIGTAQLHFSGQAITVPARISLSDSAISFGSFTRCNNTSSDKIITISNGSCDSILLSGAFVGAGSGFSLLRGGDTILGPNESASYVVHFSDSVTGSFASVIHIHSVGIPGGNSIDTAIPISASIVEGTRLAALNLKKIDFGTTSICEERDSSVTITNEGCEADTILNAWFSSSQFALDTAITFPIILSPDSSMSFSIITHLDTAGHPRTIAGTLNFSLDSGLSVPAITLTRSVSYPGIFSLSLGAERTASVKSTVPVYVLLHGTIPSQVSEIDFDLLCNDNLLGYDSILQPDVILLGQTLLPNGLTDFSFAMHPATDRDTVATLQFLSYLTKNDSTIIQLANPHFQTSGAVSLGCISTLDTSASSSNFSIHLACGDSLLHAVWENEPFAIESIEPNPARSSIEIRFSRAASIPLSLSVFNVLGQGVLSVPQITGTEMGLNINCLPSGVYYFRCSSEAFVLSRRIVIER